MDLLRKLPLTGLLLACTLYGAQAQVDMNSLLQQAQAGKVAGVSMVEDTDPFTPNTFIGSLRMEVRTYTNGTEAKDSPMAIRMHSKADMTVMEPEVKEKGMERMRILTDHKGKWQYTLVMDKKGKGTGMKMKKMKMVIDGGDTDDDDIGDARVERTGETRAIHGRTCHKYVITDEEGTWTGWIAEDTPSPFMDMANSMTGATVRTGNVPKGVNGMPMESEYVAATGGERVVLTTTEFSLGEPDAKHFSLAGYEIMEMPTMPFGR